MAKKTSEHEIMNQIRLWCGRNEILCFRANVGGVRADDGRWFTTGLPSGFSDLLCLMRGGRCLFVEVKDEKGRQRDDQKKFEETVTEYGFTYMLVRSLDEFIFNIKLINL